MNWIREVCDSEIACLVLILSLFAGFLTLCGGFIVLCLYSVIWISERPCVDV